MLTVILVFEYAQSLYIFLSTGTVGAHNLLTTIDVISNLNNETSS